jgi:ABC-type amino acid transport substrate-binding protein
MRSIIGLAWGKFHRLPWFLVLLIIMCRPAWPLQSTQNITKPVSATLAFWQQLNLEEKTYLINHPILSVQNEMDYIPWNFSVNDEPRGYSVDYIRLIGDVMGTQFKFVNGYSWFEYLQMLKSGELDLMVNIARSDEREEHYVFTTPFENANLTLVTKKGLAAKFGSLQKLTDHTIAVVNGYIEQGLLKKNFPKINRHLVYSEEQGLEAVAQGKADAFILSHASARYRFKNMPRHNLTTTLVTHETRFPVAQLHIASVKHNVILRNILQSAMSFVSSEQELKLRNKWYGDELLKKQPKLVMLSEAERHFLDEKGTISVQANHYPPVSYLIDGKPKGFSVELIELIAQKLNIKLEYKTGKTWGEFIHMLKHNELDLMMNIALLPQREVYATFTEPYMTIFNSVVSRKSDAMTDATKSSLAGKRIALGAGYANNVYLRKVFSESIFVTFSDTLSALRAISDHEADVFVDAKATVNYYIHKHLMADLKTSPMSKSAVIPKQQVAFAVNKQNPLLISAINKAYKSLSEQQLQKLRNQWFSDKSLTIKSNFTVTQAQQQWLASHQETSFYLPT